MRQKVLDWSFRDEMVAQTCESSLRFYRRAARLKTKKLKAGEDPKDPRMVDVYLSGSPDRFSAIKVHEIRRL